MGNYRFKLSDMIPNVWFHKLKDMSRVRHHRNSPPSKKKKQQTSASATQPSKPKQPHQYDPRKSYYFSRDQLNRTDGYHNSPTNPKSSENQFPDPPRKSSKQRVKKTTARSSPKLVTSCVSAGCKCRATADSVCIKSDCPPEFSSSLFGSSPEHNFLEPEFRSDRILATESFDGLVSWSSTCGRKAISNADEIVIKVDNKSFSAKLEKLDGFNFNSLSEPQLPPIITKTAKFNDLKKTETKEPAKYGKRNSTKFEESTNAHESLSVKVEKENRITMKEQRTSLSKRFSVTSPGVRLRINSPRISGRKIQAHNRKNFMSTSSSSSRKCLSDSFAVVKSSFDPQRDFRDSMVEMILEKNIKASKDLEDLLACYLSLNSDEYHDLIIEVFKQIWFDLTDRPK